MTISVRDTESSAEEGWVKLRLEMHGVDEVLCSESARQSHQVLSDELYIGHFNGMFFLDFGAGVIDPDNEEEFRQSAFYVVAKAVKWEVEEYTE